MQFSGNKTRAEINLEALRHNLNEIKKITPLKTKIIAVVKANAYGHGAKEISLELQRNGVDWFAVFNAHEAIALRSFGIVGNILMFGQNNDVPCDVLKKHNITQTVFSQTSAENLQNECEKAQIIQDVHIKIDTGMGRLGFVYSGKEEQHNAVKKIYSYKNLNVTGIYTHLSHADGNVESAKEYTKLQWKRFETLINELQKCNINVGMTHIQNSAGVITTSINSDLSNCENLGKDNSCTNDILPSNNTECKDNSYTKNIFTSNNTECNEKGFSPLGVRVGIALYGVGDFENPNINLKPVMELKSTISMIKTVEKGEYIGYSQNYITPHEMKIATVPIGYADGYPRALSNRGYALIGGKRAKITGNICMDQIMLDVTDIDAYEGQTVTLFGHDNNNYIKAEELAKLTNTIGYEIVCRIGDRVHRKTVRGSVEKQRL